MISLRNVQSNVTSRKIAGYVNAASIGDYNRVISGDLVWVFDQLVIYCGATNDFLK